MTGPIIWRHKFSIWPSLSILFVTCGDLLSLIYDLDNYYDFVIIDNVIIS